jgi:hypothetical protein
MLEEPPLGVMNIDSYIVKSNSYSYLSEGNKLDEGDE